MMGNKEAWKTLENNLHSTLNLIWCVKNLNKNCHIIKLGTMGEYGTPNIDIEEGWIDVKHNKRYQKFLYPRQASSLYHTSKIMDTDLLWFYARTNGIRVTDLWGNRISDGKSFLRHLALIVNPITLGIGFLMVSFTKNKQGLHDIMAGCLVIKKNQETKIQEPSIIKKFVDKLITKIQDLSIIIKFLDKLMNFMGVKNEGWKRIIIAISPIYFIYICIKIMN